MHSEIDQLTIKRWKTLYSKEKLKDGYDVIRHPNKQQIEKIKTLYNEGHSLKYIEEHLQIQPTHINWVIINFVEGTLNSY